MTFKKIFIQTMQDVLNKDRTDCEKIFEIWHARYPGADINKKYSEAEAAALMTSFKDEGSGILAMLVREGSLKEWAQGK